VRVSARKTTVKHLLVFPFPSTFPNLQKPLRRPPNPRIAHFLHSPFSILHCPPQAHRADAARARAAHSPRPDGRRRRASDGLSQRSSLRLGRRPPFSAAAKFCTIRFASRSGRGGRRAQAGRGASRSGCAAASDEPAQGHARRAPLHAQALRRREPAAPST
jgi:hypothetical protein